MARAINCDMEECGLQAAVLVTNLSNGEVLALCPGHWSGFVVATAEGFKEEEAAKIAAAAEPDAKPSGRRRKSSGEPTAEAAPETEAAKPAEE